jgi:beta-mannanase
MRGWISDAPARHAGRQEAPAMRDKVGAGRRDGRWGNGGHWRLGRALPAALLLACLGSAPASADTQTFTPVADSYVSATHPASAYGTSSRLSVDGSPTIRSYLRFDVQLPSGATISAATLRLYTTSSSTSVGYSVSGVPDTAWSEAALTFNNAPALGLALGSSGPWSTTGYKGVALPAGALKLGPNSFAATTTSSSAKTFSSREGTQKPQLVVDYSLPTTSSSPAPPQAPSHGPAVPASGAYFGAYANPDALNGQSRQEVLDVETAIGRRLAVGHHYRSWTSGYNLTSTDQADEGWDVANGRIPLISQSDSGYSGSINILDAINDGSQDALIRSHADAIRSFGHPLLFRLFWEMNGDWNSYNESIASTPGTTDGAQKFIDAWRRVHGIFQQEGATNAGFVWCPDVSDKPRLPENHWTRYYPGDAYVDWVCADGYNRGTSASWSSWTGFDALFAPLYADYSQKPFLIAETGSVEAGGDKAQWIRDAGAYLQTSMPRAKAFVWFDRGATAAEPYDWRIDTSQASLDAYRSMAAAPYFSP